MGCRVSLVPLQQVHFPLLERWLNAPHVWPWWPRDEGVWTLEAIRKKYTPRTEGKAEVAPGVCKPLAAFVIYAGDQPAGYIQGYHVEDFPRERPVTGLPPSTMVFDLLTGEESLLGQGTGCQAILLLATRFRKQDYLFADPDPRNHAAVRCYQKAGLKPLQWFSDCVWMLGQPGHEGVQP